MCRYLDGFIHPIPKDKLDAYKTLVASVADIWKEHGALDYWECDSDGFSIEGIREFTDVLSTSDSEVVVFGWVLFKSQESRDIAHKKVAEDARMKELMAKSDTGFDATRMVYGGFTPFVP